MTLQISWMDRWHADASTPCKSVADRYFDLYQEEKVNGLHLVAFWYGDGPTTVANSSASSIASRAGARKAGRHRHAW